MSSQWKEEVTLVTSHAVGATITLAATSSSSSNAGTSSISRTLGLSASSSFDDLQKAERAITSPFLLVHFHHGVPTFTVGTELSN